MSHTLLKDDRWTPGDVGSGPNHVVHTILKQQIKVDRIFSWNWYLPHWVSPIIDGERSLTQKQQVLEVLTLPLWDLMKPISAGRGQYYSKFIPLTQNFFMLKIISKNRPTFVGSMAVLFGVLSLVSVVEFTFRLLLTFSCKVGAGMAYENK